MQDKGANSRKCAKNAVPSPEPAFAHSENRMLFAEKHRTIWQVAEAGFVFSQEAIDLLAFGSAQRLNEVLRFVPPYLGQPIISGFSIARLLCGGIQGSVQCMALHITLGPQSTGVSPNEWPVVLQPILPEGLGTQVWPAADAINEF